MDLQSALMFISLITAFLMLPRRVPRRRRPAALEVRADDFARRTRELTRRKESDV